MSVVIGKIHKTGGKHRQQCTNRKYTDNTNPGRCSYNGGVMVPGARRLRKKEAKQLSLFQMSGVKVSVANRFIGAAVLATAAYFINSKL